MSLADAVLWFNHLVLVYFLAVNGAYFLLLFVSVLAVSRHMRRLWVVDYTPVIRSEMTPPISVIVPAYNEQATIVESVRSLLALQYPRFEVLVVNDGSTDATLATLVEAFELRRTDRVFRRSLHTKPVGDIYRTATTADLLVLDKENGGKADALNAGINVCTYPLFCAVDADSILEEDALLRVVKPFLERAEEVVASSGTVRIANGCQVEKGRVVRADLPRRMLPLFQVVEYLRGFLCGRVGWAQAGMLVIISGAFGLFRKASVIASGGYRLGTVGEDMELVVRLHRWSREQRRKYRVDFVPDPVCWTEAPATLRSLGVQRRRWQRGLVETLLAHWRMLFNPRYGRVGLLALPFFLLFEMLGPVVEIMGYIAVPASYFLGLINANFLVVFFAAAVMLGVFLSIGAVLIEELSFRRYPELGDVLSLVLYSVIENFGYRQLTAVWRMWGLLDFARRRKAWGVVPRAGFQPAPASK